MIIFQHGKIGNGLKLIEIRACKHEKVAGHTLTVAIYGEFRERIKNIMESVYKLKVPITVDVKAGNSLNSMSDI